MILKFNNYLFFNKKEIGTRSKLLRLYKVKKNTYAGQVVDRIYNSLFGNPINIKSEFLKYYKKEFEYCNQYLICHFNMPEELARKICNEKKYYVDLNWKVDQIWNSFTFDEILTEKFWNLVGGMVDES